MMPDPVSNVPDAQCPQDSERAIDWFAVMRRHDSDLRRTVLLQLRGGHEDAVDDIMQELAIAVATSNSLPEKEDKVFAWLRQVARHKVQDYWRSVQRGKRLKDSFQELSLPQQVIPTPFEWVLQLESHDSVVSALQQLPEEDRALLLHKYQNEKCCNEIAQESGLSLKAIEYRLSRARQLLRKILHSTRDN